VVICAYTLDRWFDLVSSITSAQEQLPPPDEIWLVVDHNDALLTRARTELAPAHPTLRVVANTRKQGLSGARNTALEQLQTDLVVFLDDDASAEPEWLNHLVAAYADPSVIAVGGAATPKWPQQHSRPVTLPAAASEGRGELDWVVGCTYQGQPEELEPVRNLMGCNMSFRHSIFAEIGGFGEELGRVGKTPLGCEETEFCIRARIAHPEAKILFEPRALVRHHVSRDRLTWRYLGRRCFAEGISKAAVAAMVGQDHALESELSYATRVLPAGVLRELRAALHLGETQRLRRLAGAVAIIYGLAATTMGYVRGRVAAKPALSRVAVGAGEPGGVHR
jgi:GT2 family glycosyltransferase